MRDDPDDVDLRLLAVGLHDGQSQRRKPPHRISSLADDVCAGPEPLLDLVSPGEQVGNCFEGQLSDIETGLVGLLLREEILVPELLVDLLAGADEGDPVDAGHHCLLNRLPLDVLGQLLGQLVDLLVSVLPRQVFSDHLDHHLGDVRVDVAGLFSGTEVDLVGALDVAAESGVVLQAVAAAVLMDVHVGNIVFRTVSFEGPREVDDAADGLPTVLVLQPLPVPQRIRREFVDQVEVLLQERQLIGNGCLVLAHQVGRVNFEPSHA